MSYEFPDEPVGGIVNQFMLGDKFLVAPIYQKDKTSRDIYVPKGEWLYQGESIYSEGEMISIQTEYGIPVVFERKEYEGKK